MRLLVRFMTAAAVATLALPANAASPRSYRYHSPSLQGAYGAAGPISRSAETEFGGWGTGPYWQGEPTDRLPIWRYGYYQGNDPDNRIRQQLMRDPTNR
jgi:hypothetical protein